VTATVEVREAGGRDAAALSLVGAATFLETFAGLLDGEAIVEHCRIRQSEDYYRTALSAGCRAFVAETATGRAPVGFALVGPPDLPVAVEGDLELKRIYILSRYQGSGTGSTLMDAALNAAAAYRRVLLGVYSGNSAARAFYERKGFAPIGTRDFFVGEVAYDDTIYAKAVTA
jgi:ribosomal protein S18 acetylase RimI-like enzyme